ncbi:BspA family leucine-rich repeat surface protein [uncultured Croceitalea sp.]|uniref:BspA family leucine-rich repeat surface protein n=1 Tax=uncultured Croceitalea sp. TaxID=1798908 RepID=UPI00330630DB
MTRLLLLPFILLFAASAYGQGFMARWDTDRPGSNNNQVAIPTNPAFTYSYTVDWGDGATDNNVTGDITHTYAAPGIYIIEISGTFPAIYFNDAGDRRKIIEILQWGTIQWQSMEDAFHGCENLNFDAIDAPDLSQVTSLKNMFRGGSLFNGIVNNWNVGNVTDISGMFYEAEIFNRPLDNWNTSSITDMSYTFYRARQFNEPLDNWNTGSVNTLEYTFSEAGRFNQNINNWNVNQVTNMSGTFRYANNFNRPLNNWNVSNATDMSSMLSGTAFNHPIENWNVSNVTNMSYMFYQSQFNQPIEGWNVSNVTDMSYMLARMPTFNRPLNGWNVSAVTNMQGMFDAWPTANTQFNQPLNGWDVSNVTNMSFMFRYTNSFDQPLNNWIVDQVTTMESMFSRALVFNQDLSSWNVDNVTNMQSMFQQTAVFDQPLNGWNVGNVTNMRLMFSEALLFNQPLNGWNTGNVIDIRSMFSLSPVFNQPLNNWNTGAVTNMSSMFQNSTAFDQNLASWNISAVTDMANMLSNAALSSANYDNTLIGWAGQTVQSNVSLGATGLRYCDGREERQQLIDNTSWTITGDAIANSCDFVSCTNLVSPRNGDTNVPSTANLIWATNPEATGYRISVRRVNGGVEQIIYNDFDAGNVTGIDFTTDLTPGDEVFVTIVPYNATGTRATGCSEESFTVVPTWVNSPTAFKLTYDTRLQETGSTPSNQLKIETNTGYPDYLTYDYSIDWGDDQFDNNVTGDLTHTYLTPGIYTIAIIGDFPAPLHDYSNTDAIKLISIDQWGTQPWQSMERAFYYCENMEYNANDVPDLSAVSSMSNMFAGCRLFNGNIDNWDVSNVSNMSSLFIGAGSFNQPLNSWNVENVTVMRTMFLAARSFDQPLNNWNTGNVTDMSRMFEQTDIFNQNIESWNVSNVTDMSSMFERAILFNQPLNNWNVDNVRDMSKMFDGFVFDMIFDQPLDNWNVANVAGMSYMFRRNINFNQPLNGWNVSNVSEMEGMFERTAVFDQPLDSWNVSNVVNMSSMFNSALAFNQPLNSWNVSRVTTMRGMFLSAQSFNQPLSNWDVNSVVDMSFMFDDAQVFNQPLDAWNVSAVANMGSMFKDAIVFDQVLNSWNVSSVTLMPSMFEGATVFNSEIGNWDISSVTDLSAMFKDAITFNQSLTNWDTGEALTMAEMFNGASSFDQNLDGWDVSFVTTMEEMFKDALVYNQNMDSWNVASVTTMESMFQGATAFDGLIGSWNVRGVNTMEYMFDGATSFNQELNDWRVNGVENMDYMFRNATAFNQPLERWNLGNVSMQSAFQDASSFDQNLEDWDVSGVTNMQNMLDNTALTRENYDSTLIGWSEQTLTPGINLGANTLLYCDAQEERQSMIDNFGWSFTGDVLDCPIPECTVLASPENGDVDVPVNTNLNWEPTLYASEYKLTIRIQPSGTIINETVVNDTFYDFATDFTGGETVFVTIVPSNFNGDAVGPCIEESFTVANAPATVPNCTSLSGPMNTASDVSVTTDIEWEPVANANGYRISAGRTAGATDIIPTTDVNNATSFDPPNDLPEDTIVFVTITPYNDVGDATCTAESFETQVIPRPPICTNLAGPNDGDTDVAIDTNLSWDAVDGATGYLVIVGTTSGGIETVNNAIVENQTFYDFSEDLQEDRTYYVTIIPYNNEGDATGCTEETFRTIASGSTGPPLCTTLSSPENGDNDIAINLNQITWNAAANADGYRITIDGSTSDLNDENGLVVTGTTHNFANDFDNGETVTVTIVPFNTDGNATGCTPETYTIVSAAPALPSCTTLSSPENGDIDIAIDLNQITWNPIPATNGYRITIDGSTSDLNDENGLVVTGTTHNFANDFNDGETVTVTIVPFNAEGDAMGCTPETFTIGSSTTNIPSCTNLTSPINGSIDVPVDTNITWRPVDNADGYRINVTGSTNTNNNIVDFNITSGTSYSFPEPFNNGDVITINITPYNSEGNTVGCLSETFTIVSANPTVPNCTTLTSPLDMDIDVPVDTPISWNSVPNATGYRLTIGTPTDNGLFLNNEDVGNMTTFNLSEDLPMDSEIIVLVRPYNAQGDAISCEGETFITEMVAPELPNCTTLAFPENGSINVSVDTDITWNPSENVDGYSISIGTSLGGTEILENFDVGQTTSYELLEDLPFEQQIYVTIVPYIEMVRIENCEIQSFTTATEPQVESLFGFSPDGDGNNEFWTIEGIENYPNNTVVIYNRWGDKVFQIEGYDNSGNVFRGDANQLTGFGANQLPEATYFFQIIIPENHNLKQTKGYLVLKR